MQTLTLTRPDGRRCVRLAASGVPLRLAASWYAGDRPVSGPETLTPADALELLAAGWTASAAPEPFFADVAASAADLRGAA